MERSFAVPFGDVTERINAEGAKLPSLQKTVYRNGNFVVEQSFAVPTILSDFFMRNTHLHSTGLHFLRCITNESESPSHLE